MEENRIGSNQQGKSAGKEQKSSQQRDIIYLEVLRIIAVFLVLFNHTGQEGFTYFVAAKDSMFYPLYLFISIADKIAVPLFFMVSGALLIHKEETICMTYKKRIIRMVIVLVCASFIVYFFDTCSGDFTKVDVGSFFINIYQKPIKTRFWYLYSYLAILVMLPLLRKLAKAMTIKEYGYLFGGHVIVYGIVPILEYFLSKGKVRYSSRFDPVLLSSYNIFFFMFGYCLEHVLDEKFSNRRSVIALNVAGMLTICLTSYLTHLYFCQSGDNSPQKFHSVLISVPSIAVFYTVKWFFSGRKISDTRKKMVIIAGSTTFGIYLFENWYRRWTHFIYFFLKPYLGSMFSCIIWILVACIVGGVITYILKRIPLIRKLL